VPAPSGGGRDVRVLRVRVAPPEVGVQAAGDHGMARVVRVVEHELAKGPNWHSIGLAQVGGGCGADLDGVLTHQVRIFSPLWAERLPEIT
jgi:hypothetical protein